MSRVCPHSSPVTVNRLTGLGIPQVHTLIQSLQKAAHSAGHAQPLLIGIDQENGKNTSLCLPTLNYNIGQALYRHSAPHLPRPQGRNCAFNVSPFANLLFNYLNYFLLALRLVDTPFNRLHSLLNIHPLLALLSPGAMALGSSGSPALAFETTAASAREMKMVGINWAFSPVADINSDPRNPVIGVRSFGEGAYAVSGG